MAVIKWEGFDDFATLADVLLTAAVAVGVTVVTGRGGHGKGLQIANYAGWLCPASSPVISGQALAITGGLTFTGIPLYRFRQGSTDLFHIKLDDPIAMKFYDSTGTRIGTAAYQGWGSYIWVKLTCGTTGGHVKIVVDGLTVLDAAGTFGADGSLCDNIFFEVNDSINNGLIDDLVILDTSGAYNKDIGGDTRIVSAAPTGDGADLQWTPSTGMTHYNLVNESPIDYGTTYVDAPTAPLSDTYTFPALGVTGTVAAVSVRMYAATSSGGADAVRGLTRISATDYASGTDLPVHAVYTGLDGFFEADPSTVVPWTTAGVNAAEFGPKRTV